MSTVTAMHSATVAQSHSTTNTLWSQTLPVSVSNNEQSDPAAIASKDKVAGGNLRKGLDRLVKVLERRVDRQVLAAQIRAYQSPPEAPTKPNNI
jgi:hypothetical protein